MRSVARLLVHEVSEALFGELPNCFCILRCNSGSMQWLNKIWICEKYSVSELNFFLGKICFAIFCMIYKFAIAITKIHFAIWETRSDNSNPGRYSNLFKINTKPI